MSIQLLDATSADLIRTYLREIGRVPLLTPDEEIVYGKQVQQMMSLLSAKESLRKKLRREATLSEWAEHFELSFVDLNQTLRQGQRAKQKMVEANLRLVVAIAKKYRYRGMELLDLVQEGAIGLQRAVEKFDPTKGSPAFTGGPGQPAHDNYATGVDITSRRHHPGYWMVTRQLLGVSVRLLGARWKIPLRPNSGS